MFCTKYNDYYAYLLLSLFYQFLFRYRLRRTSCEWRVNHTKICLYAPLFRLIISKKPIWFFKIIYKILGGTRKKMGGGGIMSIVFLHVPWRLSRVVKLYTILFYFVNKWILIVFSIKHVHCFIKTSYFLNLIFCKTNLQFCLTKIMQYWRD